MQCRRRCVTQVAQAERGSKVADEPATGIVAEGKAVSERNAQVRLTTASGMKFCCNITNELRLRTMPSVEESQPGSHEEDEGRRSEYPRGVATVDGSLSNH